MERFPAVDMIIAPLPHNESQRLERLRAFGVLDSLPQKAFDDITALASAICGTPIALITLIDEDRQWFKSRVGIDVQQTEREIAFCSHAILQPTEVMVVEDATTDVRFHDNPLVQSAPNVRFYAGSPIVTNDGYAIGTVCVADSALRQLQPHQLQALRSLSSLVVTLLEHEKLIQTEQHRLTEEVFRYNEYLAAVTASGLDLLSFIDKDLVYRYVNPTYLKYWGRASVDIVDRKVIDLVGSELFQHTVEPRLRLALAGQQVDFEATVDFTAMGPRYVAVTYLPARNADGSVIGVIVRTHNINTLKQREEQLRESVALLEHKTLQQERFIHIVSHDLREPINTINNFASLLAEDTTLNLPDVSRRYLSFVAAGGQRIKSLLDDLMDFLQLDRPEIERQPVDVTSIASQVRDDLASALQRSQGRIEFGHLSMAYGDPSLVRIALQNLVANSLKFVAKGTSPVVKIDSKVLNGALHIEVRDNGIGMEPQQIAKIFEMFQRLHSSKAFPGSGLGLSICRRIAELHGGEVSATSEPGVGSCFTLVLPLMPIVGQERNGDEHL